MTSELHATIVEGRLTAVGTEGVTTKDIQDFFSLVVTGDTWITTVVLERETGLVVGTHTRKKN